MVLPQELLLGCPTRLAMVLGFLYALEPSEYGLVVGLESGQALGVIVDLDVHGLDGLVRLPTYLAQTIDLVEHLLLVLGLRLRTAEQAYADGGEGDAYGYQADELPPTESVKFHNVTSPDSFVQLSGYVSGEYDVSSSASYTGPSASG